MNAAADPYRHHAHGPGYEHPHHAHAGRRGQNDDRGALGTGILSHLADPADPAASLRRAGVSASFQHPTLRHLSLDLQTSLLCPDGDAATTTTTTITPPSQPSPARRRTRGLPDWGEFYKNGIPREIIVIEDTPEPPAKAATTTSSFSSLLSSNYFPSSSASSSTTTTTTTTAATTTTATIRHSDTALTGPLTDARQRSGTSRKRPHQDADAAGAGPGADEPGIQKAPIKVEALDANPAPVAHKRRRTRLQVEHESNIEYRLAAAAHVTYRGLPGPVKRAGNVFIRSPYAKLGADKRKLDDDDGHYIVVPDTTLAGQYQIRKLLGQGTFGKVVQALDRSSNQLVAVKIIRAVQKYRDAARIELRVLRTLRDNDGENQYRCIGFRDCFDFYGHTCIVMDLLDSSLFDFLKANAFVPFPNSHIQSFARQLLTSVAFIHDLGLIHTDLKPENILLRDASFQTFTYNKIMPCSRDAPPRQAAQRRVLMSSDIRLIDFGSATFQEEYHSSIVATRHYRAPEIILGLGWSFPCDIWSIGCILVEFFTGDALFQTHDNLEHLAMMEAVFGARIDIAMVRQVNKATAKNNVAAGYFKRLKLNYPTNETSRASRRFVKSMRHLDDIIPKSNSFLRQFLDLLHKMFVYDPAGRISAKEALLHPWFQEHVRDDGTEAAKIALERAKLAQRHVPS